MKTLRLILGDQLNTNHSWFEKTDKNVVYLMAEMRQETDYVKHHIQKIVAFFLSMRSFAADLKSKNHQVIYFEINDKNNLHDLKKIINYCIVILNRFKTRTKVCLKSNRQSTIDFFDFGTGTFDTIIDEPTQQHSSSQTLHLKELL